LLILGYREEQRVQALAGKAGSDVHTWKGFTLQGLAQWKELRLAYALKRYEKGEVEGIKKDLGLK
jgi:hypothetical protein